MSESMWIALSAVVVSVASICTSAYSMRIQRKIEQLRKADDE